MYGRGQECPGGRNSVVQAIRLNIFSVRASMFVPRPVNQAGIEAQAAGSGPGSVERPMPDRKAAIERLRERAGTTSRGRGTDHWRLAAQWRGGMKERWPGRKSGARAKASVATLRQARHDAGGDDAGAGSDGAKRRAGQGDAVLETASLAGALTLNYRERLRELGDGAEHRSEASSGDDTWRERERRRRDSAEP